MYSLKKRWATVRLFHVTVKLSPMEEFIEQVNKHTHASSPTQVEVTKFKVGIKCKARTTEETVQQVLGKQLSNISEDATTNMPFIQ